MDGSLYSSLLIVAIVLFVIWLPIALTSSLRLLTVWQQKEYRRDRMRAYRDSWEGQQQFRGAGRMLRIWFIMIVIILFLGMWLVNSIAAPEDSSRIFSYYLVLLFLLSVAMAVRWAIECWHVYADLTTHQFKRPQLTGKMLLLLTLVLPIFLYALATLILVFPGQLLFYTWPGLGMLRTAVTVLYIPFLYLYAAFGFHIAFVVGLTLLDLLTPVIISFWVAVFSPLTTLGKRRLARKARRTMQQYPDLRVIAVTGSYGKSSTKELIASILASRYRVAKTAKNQNTLVGVSNTVLQSLKGDEEFFVVEMGAYTRGEIRELCSVTAPRISVVTAINEQHLSLFGSTLEDTAAAKYEIIEGLGTSSTGPTQPSIAVLNADDEHTARMASWIKERSTGSKTRVFLYSAKGRINAGGSRTALLAMNVKQSADGVKFLLVDNQQEKQSESGSLSSAGIEVLLPGVRKDMVGNYLAAICVALSAGMTIKEIVEAIKVLPAPLPGTYSLKPGLNRSQVIDESYSSNPDGFLAALEYLRSVEAKRRIVVTRGMIELGSLSDAAHRRVGEKIATSADQLWLTSRDSEQEYREGIGHADRKGFRTTVETSPLQMVQYLRTQIKEGDVVLIEGRVPQMVHSLLCKE